MANENAFTQAYKTVKSDKKKLKSLLRKSDEDEISVAILDNIENKDLGLMIWQDVLSNVKPEEKLFTIVKNVLPKLNRDLMSTKTLSDFYSNLCINLPEKSLLFAIHLAQFCDSHITFGDPRACFFKDILPCILQILQKTNRNVVIDGIESSSLDHHKEIIDNLLTKPFKPSILPSITAMFKDIPLTKQQNDTLIGKICAPLQNVDQNEIPRLALACFELSLFNKLIIPVLALDAYFYTKRYKKKFMELESECDFESIDEVAERGMIETEENVICHFQQVTEFTSIEKDIVASLTPLAFAPKLIISPFIATVLVSFAKMSSSSSVAGNLRLPQSILLPFMKQVFKNNEKHRRILDQSAWARSIDKQEPVDIGKLLKVIQENTCKLNQNAALNGFIGLTFMLLRTKDAPILNNFAVSFLSELVKQRPEFTMDITKILVKMLFSEPNKAPIIELFDMIINRRSLAIDRYEDALTELIENLTELDHDTAMALESILHTTLIRSTRFRELMTNTMRNAMYQPNPQMRKLAIHSFCVMLKYARKPRGTGIEAMGSSQNLSMMSLISQSQLPSTGEANMRKVSVMVLEILGILRKCLSHKAEFRVRLYDSLLDAVTANEFIIPSVLEFIEPYFREYFDTDDDGIVNFDNIVKENSEGELVVMDHVGKFLNFFIGCLEVANDKKMLDEDGSMYRNFHKIIGSLIEKIDHVDLEKLGVFSVIDQKNSVAVTQFLGCIEALMSHCCRNLKLSGNVKKFSKLFEVHQKIKADALRVQANSKKAKKGKNVTDIATKKTDLVFQSIWSLRTCLGFAKIIFDETTDDNLIQIQQNTKFIRFALESMNQKIQEILTSTEILYLKNHRLTFPVLRDVSTILYQQLKPEKFKKFYEDCDAESAVQLSEAFKNAIACMDIIFPTKWSMFLQKLTKSNNPDESCMLQIVDVCMEIIDWAFDTEDDNNLSEDSNGQKIINNVFTILSILYKNLENMSASQHLQKSFKWMLNLCKTHKFEKKEFQTVNGMLITLTSHESGNVTIKSLAQNLSLIFGEVNTTDAVVESSQDKIESITKDNVDYTFQCFVVFLKKQIEQVEFFVYRMKSFNVHVKTPGQVNRDESIRMLSSLENSIVIRLTAIGEAVAILGNSRFNLKTNQIEVYNRVVINYFGCLQKLIRHFSQRFDVKNIDYKTVKLESLMKQSKKTVKVAYNLFNYIEDMYKKENDENDQNSSNSTKKKVVTRKELKSADCLVKAIEDFSLVVIKFDTVSKSDFKKHLHNGEVRGFRILSATSSTATSKRNSNANNESDKDEEESENEEEEEANEDESSPQASSSVQSVSIDQSSDEVEEVSESEEEPSPPARRTSLRSKNSYKRKIVSDSEEDEAASDEEEEVSATKKPLKFFRARAQDKKTAEKPKPASKRQRR